VRRTGGGGLLAAIFFAVMVLAPGGCVRDEGRHQDLKPPPGFVPPPLRPLHNGPRDGGLGFGRGFFAVEWGADGKTWHWMGARGEIRLPNDQRPHTLRISGWFPLEFLGAPPAIRILLEDQVLDSFSARDRALKREYLVRQEQLGAGPAVRLVLETSATARAPGDPRALGIAIEEVGWQ
jgi:hypothetical protein